MKKVIVIGGGPAGLMAAAAAARAGAKVILLEKMPQVGRKLALTGHGRCNVTAAVNREQMVKGFPGNGRFLYSAFSSFSNDDLIAFLESMGVPTRVEEGSRVFPVSDNAEDVVAALHRNAVHSGVEIMISTAVEALEIDRGMVQGVRTSKGAMAADAIIVATGGKSYPGTGSTGDGYKWAQAAGHKIIPPRPSLVPLLVEESWIKYLQGISLAGIAAVAYEPGGRVISRGQGDLMFTHYGLSGPMILAMSKDIGDYLHKNIQPAVLKLDLKADCSAEQLDWLLQKMASAGARKQLKNSLAELLPPRLIAAILELAGIEPDKVGHQLTRQERQKLTELIKVFPVHIVGTRPIAEAIVTAGGVDVKTVNPATMESRLVKGLYFAGELLDVDGYTGGYNLQAAFSTGFVAGSHAGTETD